VFGGARPRPRTSGAVARRRRRKKRAVKPRVLLVVGLALLIAGFLFRRMMIPSAMHYLTYRTPDASSTVAPASGAGEHLTPQDKQQLDQVLKEKAK
jgi:uncharacterized membrane protein